MFGIHKSLTAPSHASTEPEPRWYLNQVTFWRLDLAPRHQVHLKCLSGRIWVTRSGDYGDYVMVQGVERWLAGPGTIIAQGFGPAVLASHSDDGSSGAIEYCALTHQKLVG